MAAVFLAASEWAVRRAAAGHVHENGDGKAVLDVAFGRGPKFLGAPEPVRLAGAG